MGRRRRSTPGLDGLLLLAKPAGPTSHDQVAVARRLFGQPRLGHAGTLDPPAAGLLLLCLGRATRLLEFLVGHDKTYHGELVFGRATTTYDDHGETTAEADASALTAAQLQAALLNFVGALEQVPPPVSAKKIDGVRAHRLVRAGQTPELPAVPIRIDRLDLLDFTPGPAAIARVRVRCSTGTYIRALAHDLGAALGVGGHLRGLVREAVGPFTLAEATTLDTLATLDPAGRRAALRPLRDCLGDLPRAVLPPEHWPDLLLGRALPAAEGIEGPVALLSAEGDVLAIAEGDGEIWRPRKVLLQPPSSQEA